MTATTTAPATVRTACPAWCTKTRPHTAHSARVWARGGDTNETVTAVTTPARGGEVMVVPDPGDPFTLWLTPDQARGFARVLHRTDAGLSVALARAADLLDGGGGNA